MKLLQKKVVWQSHVPRPLKQFQTFLLERTRISVPHSPGEAIEGERVLPFPSNSVCGTETLSDSSNNHYCLSHLQDLLDILGLSEIESLGGLPGDY